MKFNKKIIFSVFLGIILLSLTIAGALALPSPTAYYKMDNNESNSTLIIDSSSSAFNIVTSGQSYSTTNKKVGISALTSTPSSKALGSTGTTALSVCGWLNVTNSATASHIFTSLGSYSGAGFGVAGTGCSSGDFCYYTYGSVGGDGFKLTQYTPTNNEFFHFCGVTENNRNLLYINGVLDENVSGNIKSSQVLTAFPSGSMSGGYDDIEFFLNTALTGLEVEEIYNRSLAPAPLSSDNFTIDAFNIWDNSTLNNFSAEIDGVNYTTTTGNISTVLLVNDSSLYTLKVFNAYNLLGPHFNTTYSNLNISSKKSAFLVQSDIRTQPREAWTNNTINTTVTINGTTYDEPLFLSAGSYNITSLTNGSYKQKEFITTINALDNYTVNLNDIYTTILNITVKNAYTGQNLTNWTGNISSSGIVYSFSTSNGSVAYPVLDSLVYLTYVQAPDYSISYVNNYANITPSGDLYKYNFSLYSNNSVMVNIYDSQTAVLITSNISITVTGNETEDVYYTTTGTYFLENLIDGNYTFKVLDVAGNYSLSSYLVTVADSSTQTLNVYLTSNADQVVFTYLDSSSLTTLEGVTVSQSKLINTSYVLIESKNTDITGRIQFNYLPGSKYRFTSSKTNYTSKVFELDPVLFSTYTVQLDRVTRVDITKADYGGIIMEYTPKEFYNDENNTFLFVLQSPDGYLEEYYINISFGSNFNYSSGNNSYGETFNLSLEVLNASMYESALFTFYYKSVTGQEHIFVYSIPIIGGNPSIDTFFYNAGEDYGLGWFERVLIATGILIIVAGIVFLVAGATPGLVVGLMLMGYFSYIGFIPLWGVIISVFVGVIMLSRNPGASYG